MLPMPDAELVDEVIRLVRHEDHGLALGTAEAEPSD